MTKKSKPIIGITVDYQTDCTYSNYPWYALRANYADAVTDSGGIPILIPYTADAVEIYAHMLDGLIISGGNFDINPAYYQEQICSDTVILNDPRTSFEMALTTAMLALNKPVLGICGGQQLLNVILGGKLIQHIPDVFPNALEHEQKTPKHEPSHEIRITSGTLLEKIVKCKSYMVNSSHHQAVKMVGPDVIVNAIAPDGVIEGIESTTHKFCLGVEWHPEYGTSNEDTMIFTAFINACNEK